VVRADLSKVRQAGVDSRCISGHTFSSDALGGAYGIAVSMLMAVTTVLAALVGAAMGLQSASGGVR
jgi:hypothetical protein